MPQKVPEHSLGRDMPSDLPKGSGLMYSFVSQIHSTQAPAQITLIVHAKEATGKYRSAGMEMEMAMETDVQNTTYWAANP